tara:strand:+ start:674 stop:796 length:123 start_codon:yes stop_codon:yes gene_type:complete
MSSIEKAGIEFDDIKIILTKKRAVIPPFIEKNMLIVKIYK